MAKSDFSSKVLAMKPPKKIKEATPEEIERRKQMERMMSQKTFKPNLKTIPWKK